MTKDERLFKRALDVLDWAHDVFGLEEEGIATKTALRERLAQPEQCQYPQCQCATESPCLKGLAQPEQEPVAHTTGHCENHKQKGGCQLHNLQCGWPDCDRKPITDPPQRKPEQELVIDCPRCGHCCPPQGIYYTPPQQEPVAWMDPSWANPDTRGWASESFKSAPIDGWTPLYTALPQRKPLTDEEISNIWCKVSNTDFVTADTHEFARAIEAAHGIKGQA